jgi:rSAM/selenodomain-associated transferase 1
MNVEGPAVAILARQPVPGRTKSRLVADSGGEAAARLAAALLQDVAAAIGGDGRWHAALFVEPPEATEEMAALTGLEDVRAQPEGDLGARMLDAARRLETDGAAPIVIVGSDIPTLAARHVDLALRSLSRADVVFGPADDGGYYLVGMNRVRPELFDDASIEWGGPNVLESSLELAAAARIEYVLIQSERDIDTPADLAWLRGHLDGLSLGGEPLPRHTSDMLREIDASQSL